MENKSHSSVGLTLLNLVECKFHQLPGLKSLDFWTYIHCPKYLASDCVLLLVLIASSVNFHLLVKVDHHPFAVVELQLSVDVKLYPLVERIPS